jgi:hypothetical protein
LRSKLEVLILTSPPFPCPAPNLPASIKLRSIKILSAALRVILPPFPKRLVEASISESFEIEILLTASIEISPEFISTFSASESVTRSFSVVSEESSILTSFGEEVSIRLVVK